MFKKSTRIVLSLVILFYSVGIPQAHTLSPIYSLGEAISVSQPPAASSEQKAAKDSNPQIDGAKKNTHNVAKNPRVLASSTSGRRADRKTTSAKSPGATPYADRGERNETMLRVGTEYFDRTGRELVVRSGRRSVSAQARAMYKNYKAYGPRYVGTQYRNKKAVQAITKAYLLNRKRRRNAIAAMTRVIQAQVRQGVYISNHLRGRAFDIRSRGRDGAQLAVLREVVQKAGGRVVVEKNHYHVEL